LKNAKQTVLITGVAGFVGSNLADRLVREGHVVVGIDDLSAGILETPISRRDGPTMIVTRTPYRITLGCGGTDLPSFYQEHGGFLVVVAINKYMYLNVNTPILDDLIRVRYTKTEIVSKVEQVSHTLARAALSYFGIQDGIEINSIADIPAGTGLGSSSCYLVGLLNALHALAQNPVSPQQLAEEACHIELDLLKKPIGKQDQFMAALDFSQSRRCLQDPWCCA